MNCNLTTLAPKWGEGWGEESAIRRSWTRCVARNKNLGLLCSPTFLFAIGQLDQNNIISHLAQIQIRNLFETKSLYPTTRFEGQKCSVDVMHMKVFCPQFEVVLQKLNNNYSISTSKSEVFFLFIFLPCLHGQSHHRLKMSNWPIKVFNKRK